MVVFFGVHDKLSLLAGISLSDFHFVKWLHFLMRPTMVGFECLPQEQVIKKFFSHYSGCCIRRNIRNRRDKQKILLCLLERWIPFSGI